MGDRSIAVSLFTVICNSNSPIEIIFSKSYIVVMLYKATKKVNRKIPCDRKISHGIKSTFLTEAINHS